MPVAHTGSARELWGLLMCLTSPIAASQIPKPPNPELAPLGSSVRGGFGGGGARGGYANVGNGGGSMMGRGGAGGMAAVGNGMGGGGMGAMSAAAMGGGMGNMGVMNPMVSICAVRDSLHRSCPCLLRSVIACSCF